MFSSADILQIVDVMHRIVFWLAVLALFLGSSPANNFFFVKREINVPPFSFGSRFLFILSRCEGVLIVPINIVISWKCIVYSDSLIHNVALVHLSP